MPGCKRSLADVYRHQPHSPTIADNCRNEASAMFKATGVEADVPHRFEFPIPGVDLPRSHNLTGDGRRSCAGRSRVVAHGRPALPDLADQLTALGQDAELLGEASPSRPNYP